LKKIGAIKRDERRYDLKMSNESQVVQAVQEAVQAAPAAPAVSVGWYVAAIVLFPAILMAIDAIIEYKRLEKGATGSTGISGFRRTIIALTVLLIIGIALFILIDSGKDDLDVIGNVLSMLAGIVAAIAGFYFGGKVAEKPLDAAEERADAERTAKEEVEVKAKAAEGRADAEKKAKEEVEIKAKAAEERADAEKEAKEEVEKKVKVAEERADTEKEAKEEVEKKVKVAEERADAEKKVKEEVEKKVKEAEEELRVLKERGKS
jgi:flagellar biosynthesis GTPase FlhF